MKCESCASEHDGAYGSGRFCGSKCARGFATKAKREEINNKVSRTTAGIPKPHSRTQPKHTAETIARIAETTSAFWTKEQRELAASRRLGKTHSCESKAKLKASAQQRVIDGRHNGWPTRKNRKPSYAEQYFIDYFNSIGVAYERERPCGFYFIDFAFEDQMIALEIDGKQHALRQDSDKKKDAYLLSKGWKVYRIPWVNPIGDAAREVLHTSVQKFLAELV